MLLLLLYLGLIILNAWYGKFVTDNSRKHERAKVIDITVPLQCLVKDSKLILTEASKVRTVVQCRNLKQSRLSNYCVLVFTGTADGALL